MDKENIYDRIEKTQIHFEEIAEGNKSPQMGRLERTAKTAKFLRDLLEPDGDLVKYSSKEVAIRVGRSIVIVEAYIREVLAFADLKQKKIRGTDYYYIE